MQQSTTHSGRSHEEYSDEFWMAKALDLALQAQSLGEVPVGDIVVKERLLIGSGFNRRESTPSPTAHAEVLALNEASQNLKSWRLTGCTLYVTLEPCVMCAGALTQSRIDRVVFGASDPKGGALGSLYELHLDTRLNHRFEVIKGVCEKECSVILTDFFRKRRSEKR